MVQKWKKLLSFFSSCKKQQYAHYFKFPDKLIRCKYISKSKTKKYDSDFHNNFCFVLCFIVQIPDRKKNVDVIKGISRNNTARNTYNVDFRSNKNSPIKLILYLR